MQISKSIFFALILFGIFGYWGCGGGGGGGGGVESNPTGTNSTSGIVISRIEPSSGVGGTTVKVYGSGFGLVQGTSKISFSGISITPNSWLDTEISVTIPTDVPVDGSFVVSVNNLNSNSSPIFSTPTPLITSVSAYNLSSSITKYWLILGENFGSKTSDSNILFDTQKAAIQSYGGTQATFEPPTIDYSTCSDEVDIQVFRNPSKFSPPYKFYMPLYVSTVSPKAVSIGTEVTIKGKRLLGKNYTLNTAQIALRQGKNVIAQTSSTFVSNSEVRFKITNVTSSGYCYIFINEHETGNSITIQ
ncbi:MAG: IPT/TIG domain-containing protein [Candidatus Ozemobacteraceae bacterium]